MQLISLLLSCLALVVIQPVDQSDNSQRNDSCDDFHDSVQCLAAMCCRSRGGVVPPLVMTMVVMLFCHVF